VCYSDNPESFHLDVYESASGNRLQTIPELTISWGLAFQRQTGLLALSRAGRPVEIWDWNKPRVLHKLPTRGFVRGIDWHPDGRRLAGASSDGRVYVWDVEHEQIVAILTGHASEVISVHFSHSGDWLSSISWDSTLRLWDSLTGQELLRSEVDSGFDYP